MKNAMIVLISAVMLVAACRGIKPQSMYQPDLLISTSGSSAHADNVIQPLYQTLLRFKRNIGPIPVNQTADFFKQFSLQKGESEPMLFAANMNNITGDNKMNTFFDEHDIVIGEKSETAFMNKYDIYQDGTTPMYRDVDGKLWAMSGHSHMGHIGMFYGTRLDDLKELYPISTNFCVGHADYAFSGIRYPEGIKPRGSIWPFGLYISPNTHRFFCFFHNETGWNAKGTGYIVKGKGDGEPDFRHIGLMHSDDEGKNWTFDRWVITSEEVCFSELYNPDGENVLGQKQGLTCLGAGDFSLYVEPDGEYMYLFYNLCRVESESSVWNSCDTYVARTRKRTDGVMGDFVKYFNGEFCEAGNLGKETPIVYNAWHPRVVYSKKYGLYIMSCSHMTPGKKKHVIDDVIEVLTSEDMLHWSDPIRIMYEGKEFGNHYQAIVPNDDKNQPNILEGDEFYILTNHNGTDVMRYAAKIVKK